MPVLIYLPISPCTTGDEVYYLSESARIERTELVMRIKEIQVAIRHLSSSKVFADCDRVIKYYCPESTITTHSINNR